MCLCPPKQRKRTRRGRPMPKSGSGAGLSILPDNLVRVLQSLLAKNPIHYNPAKQGNSNHQSPRGSHEESHRCNRSVRSCCRLCLDFQSSQCMHQNVLSHGVHRDCCGAAMSASDSLQLLLTVPFIIRQASDSCNMKLA